MRCPKCQSEIDNNSLKCKNCGARVASVCKDCGTFNPITATECSNCGRVLLKICTNCGAANTPQATKCRKCGKEFSLNSQTNDFLAKNEIIKHSQQQAKYSLIDGIKNNDIRVLTLNGASGIGKNIVLKNVIEELKNAKLLWLASSCTQITQLSTLGYFQNILLSFFNINNFCPDTLMLKKNSFKFFKQDFPSLTGEEISDLLNILYPDKTDIYENLYFNKTRTFSMLKKVFYTITSKIKAIFVIDNFEYIDGMSYDFIQELLKTEEISSRCKFIITNSEEKHGYGLFGALKLSEKNFLDVNIASFSSGQVETYIKRLLPDYIKQANFVENVIKISEGNPSVIEQIVHLHKDLERNHLKDVGYNSVDSVINIRLNILKQEDIDSYRMLCAMSVLGRNFCVAVLEHFDNNSEDQFRNIIEKLSSYGYITPYNSLAYEFTSNLLWKKVVSIVKSDVIFEEILNIILELLTMHKQSSIALIAYVLQKLNNNDKAVEVWTLLMKQASYIGDIGLYIISQKQTMQLIENKAGDFYQHIKKNINIRLGKLLENIDYKISFEYIQKAIMMLSDDEIPLHIELLGYLASCSMKMGNYCGVLECIDNVINNLGENDSIEKTILKSKQSTPLLMLGNYGQLINMSETETLPCLEKILNSGKSVGSVGVEDIFEIWLEEYFNYAEALVLQGDNRAFEMIQNIYDILEKNQLNDTNKLNRAHLLLALANTISGDIKTSGKILEDMLQKSNMENLSQNNISRWNFIDILNKFYTRNYDMLQQELFNVVSYANNINDLFTKNILKTLLAVMLKDKGQAKRALEILEEQVTYFAKEKAATGVLLSWYLIAQIKLETSGTQFALDIASKALDVAQGPNISNYYFIALFNKLIGEIYMSKQDFDSAKVYMEKAAFVAKQFNLQYILVKTYLLMAKLYQELALPKAASRGDYVKSALKMFQLAKNVAIVPEQAYLQKEIKAELNLLMAFCKLNNIVFKPQN